MGRTPGRGSGRCRGPEVRVCLPVWGTAWDQSSFLMEQPPARPLVGPSVCGTPPRPTVASWAFPTSHTWAKTEPIPARPPSPSGRKMKLRQKPLGRGAAKVTCCPPAHASPSCPCLPIPACCLSQEVQRDTEWGLSHLVWWQLNPDCT